MIRILQAESSPSTQFNDQIVSDCGDMKRREVAQTGWSALVLAQKTGCPNFALTETKIVHKADLGCLLTTKTFDRPAFCIHFSTSLSDVLFVTSLA